MNVSGLDIVAVGGAGVVAGAINALAGGGTLIAFPCLVALGVPSVPANVTVTVGQTPGYLAGAWTQRRDIGNQLRSTRQLAVFGGVGAVAGSILLQYTPNSVFQAVVPFLILLACAALVLQDRVREWVKERTPGPDPAPVEAAGAPPPPAEAGRPSLTLSLVIGAGGVYGGFFGAGLGIMVLAILGLFSDQGLVRNNAVKQVLSFVINLAAAVAFAFGHHVRWLLVPSLAVGSILGGVIGARAVHLVPARVLRAFVVLFGVAVAISFWVG